MAASAPYSSEYDDIRGNCGCFEGCVVVSRQFSGSDYDARTRRPTHNSRVQIWSLAPRYPHTQIKRVSPRAAPPTCDANTTDDDWCARTQTKPLIHDGSIYDARTS
jgi:hypothetical protein